jgi:acetyltransferase-like isoleucine patch superfamily enzyme
VSFDPRALVNGNVGDGAVVGAFATIGAGARVGDRCRIDPYVLVSDDAAIGDDCFLHPHVSVGRGVVIGAGVEIQSGAVLGRIPGGAEATDRAPIFDLHLSIGDRCAIGAHATVYYDVEIGAGTLIGDSASLREGARIGRRCIISRCVTLNYGVTVGDGVKIMDNTHITGGMRIGNGAFVGPNVATANDNRPAEGRTDQLRGPVIESGAVVGAGATLLPGVIIGAGATVAAGAVVTRDVPPGVTVLGTPARRR